MLNILGAKKAGLLKKHRPEENLPCFPPFVAPVYHYVQDKIKNLGSDLSRLVVPNLAKFEKNSKISSLSDIFQTFMSRTGLQNISLPNLQHNVT